MNENKPPLAETTERPATRTPILSRPVQRTRFGPTARDPLPASVGPSDCDLDPLTGTLSCDDLFDLM